MDGGDGRRVGRRSLKFETFAERNLVDHLAAGGAVRRDAGQFTVFPRRRSGPGGRGTGSIDRRGGDWQGYEEQDLEVVIDLGRRDRSNG